MTPSNASISTNVPTAVDIPVDNSARDPQLVVKRRRSLAVMRCQTQYRKLAVRLKRIAAARGMTAEQLLDEMERADG